MIRKTILTAVTTVGLLAAGTGAASAHECYIANRSAQGNAGASHSANWYTLQMSDLFAEAHLFFGGDPLNEEQLAWALGQTEAQGIPLSVTMFERFTIPRSVEELEGLSTKSSDGKGVDHFFSSYGDALFQVFAAAQAR
jgi:hypothetical protein